MKHNLRLASLEALLAVIAWGASFVATKIALEYVSPITVVWLRFGIGVFILGLAVALRKQLIFPAKKDLAYTALLGFLGITFHQWLQSTGLLTAHAITTSWIVATTPIFMAILGWIVLKERLSGLQIVGILLASCGVFLVVSQGELSAIFGGRFGTVGDFLILISAVNWAVFSTLSRRGLQEQPAALMMFYVMVFGWIFNSVLLLATHGLREIESLRVDGWLAVGFLGVACSGFAYIFWFDALKALPVTQTGAYLYFEPIVTVILAVWILSEPLVATSVLGGILILLGVYLVNRF